MGKYSCPCLLSPTPRARVLARATRTGTAGDRMTEQEALERLHAAVPREVAVSLHRNTSVFARMHHAPGRLPLRRHPVESETAEHWTVALFMEADGEGDVVRSGTAKEIGRASCRKECRSRWSPYH